MLDELLDLLTYELGEIAHWEEECPGVYYLSVLPTIEAGGEYYAIFEDAPMSQEIRAMGRKLDGAPVLVYQMGVEDVSWAAVGYEILRHKTTHGLSLPESRSLRDTALYGAEVSESWIIAAKQGFTKGVDCYDVI